MNEDRSLNVVSLHTVGTSQMRTNDGIERKWTNEEVIDRQKRMKRDVETKDLASEMDKLDKLLKDFEVCKFFS